VCQPQEWGQVNAPNEDVQARVTTDLLWLKDWLHRRQIGAYSRHKQPAVTLKVLISHAFIFFYELTMCYVETAVSSVWALV
jgi:hypothetical protein